MYQHKVSDRVLQVVDEVFKHYHRTINYNEFEPMMVDSFKFYSKLLNLSVANAKAVAGEKFSKLICMMNNEDEFNDFLFYLDVEAKKRENITKSISDESLPNDNHQ